MGSLYDIGNMRYKHFTFYTRGDGTDYTPKSESFPGVTEYPPEYVTDNEKLEYYNIKKAEHDTAYNSLINELSSFLDSVWPLDAIFGYNAEDDTAYITYIKQPTDGTINIENIYVFRRTTTDPGIPPRWMLALQPIKSVNPGDYSDISNLENI